MATYLKQSTAVTVEIGPFCDATDGVTAETALTISQADVRLSKNGGAFAQKGDTTAATHMENGWYSCPLSTTDTGTLGRLRLAVNESGALPVFVEFMVVTANVWDSFFGADVLQADLTQIGGVAQSATDLKDFADAGYDPATNKVQGVVLTDTVTTYTGNTPQTGDSFARIGATGSGLTSLASQTSVTTIDDFLDTEIAAIKAVTDLIPDAGAMTSIATAAALATVDTNVDSILADTGTDGVVLANGAITAPKWGVGGFDAAALAADAANEIADALLNRNVAGGSSTGRLVKHALYRLINRVAIAAGTLTVYGTDDSTSAFTQTVTTTAGDPISEVDTD